MLGSGAGLTALNASNTTSGTLSATNFIGSGSGISNLDYNNIATNKPDLTLYPLKIYVDGSLNTINTTLGTKQNTLSFSSPLINTSNNITIDLSAYPSKTYVDGSLNTINTTLGTKQNNLKWADIKPNGLSVNNYAWQFGIGLPF